MEKELQELIIELREIKIKLSKMDTLEQNTEKLNKIILGNGGIGLCEQVRELQGKIKPLWTIVGVMGTTIIGGLIKLVFFK